MRTLIQLILASPSGLRYADVPAVQAEAPAPISKISLISPISVPIPERLKSRVLYVPSIA